MVNGARGEVAIRIDGQHYVMRLTLGALAELEDRLGSTSLVALAEKFETGGVSSNELIALLAAGIRGAGGSLTEAQIAGGEIDGAAVGAMRAGMALLARTFQPDAS